MVACSGAYMGLTTRAPQQLTLAAPLSQRTTPAVAVFSTKKHKVTRRPVRKVRLLISRPVRRGPVTTPRSILPYPALRAPTSPHTCRAARCTCGTPVAATQIKITLPFTQESFISTLIILPLNVCSSKQGLTVGAPTLPRLIKMCLTFPTSCTFAGRFVVLCLDPLP